MKTLYKFILKTYAGPMFMAFVLVAFVFVMQFLWLYMDDIAGKGLSVLTLLQFLGWVSLTFIHLSIPMGALFSSLIVMGNMGQNNELLALKASGISLNKLFLPLYISVFLLAVTSFYVYTFITPHAYYKMRTMLTDITNTKRELSIPIGIFYSEIENTSVYVQGKDPKTGALSNLIIYNHAKRGGNLSLTVADSGYIMHNEDGNILVKLINGVTYDEDPPKRMGSEEEEKLGFTVRNFGSQSSVLLIDQSSSSSSDLFKDAAGALSLNDLKVMADSINGRRDLITQNFVTEYLLSHNTFRGFIEFDTSEYRQNALMYSLSSNTIFDERTAQEKLSLMEGAITNCERASDNWMMIMLDMEKENKKKNQYTMEWHKKFSISLTCIIFFFIGAPLGSIINKGGLGWPMIISISLFIIFLVTDSFSKRMVLSNGWNPLVGAWLPLVIFVPIAVFLTYKSNTDSELFNPESYSRFFNKLFGRMHKLMEPINLEDIEILSEEEQKNVDYKDEIDKLNLAFNKYFEDVSLDKFLLSSKNIENFDDLERLEKLNNNYIKVISHLIGLFNEHIRSELKDMPVIDVEYYKYNKDISPKPIRKSFVGRIITSFVTMRKRLKLRHIIKGIEEKNIRISNSIKNVSI